MALWIDDTLCHQDDFLDLSFRARALLLALWTESKLAHNDGVFKIERLYRVSDAYSPEALAELAALGWAHRDGSGCGTDWCPKGADGYVVMHNVAGRQESSQAIGKRQKRSVEAKREAAMMTNHKRWHEDRGLVEPTCPLCVSAGQIASIA